MKFLPFIMKNIFRNKKHMILSVSALAMPVFVILLLLSIEEGFKTLINSTDELILNTYEKGNACVVSSRIFDSYKKKIEAFDGIKKVTGVLRDLFTYQKMDNTVFLTGVNYDEFKTIKKINIIDGSEDNFKKNSDGALVGKRLVNQYGWKVGQRVSMIQYNVDFLINGIFESTDKTYEGNVLVHKEYLSQKRNEEGKSTYFIIQVENASMISPISNQIDSLFANFPKPTKTQSEKDSKENELRDFQEIRKMLSILIFATIIVSIFVATNNISMALRERIVEIGTMRSIGFSKRQIFFIFITESLLLAIIGTIIGMSIAVAILITGRSLSGYIPLVINSILLVKTLSIAILIGFLGGLFPMISAARLSIVNSLKIID